VTDAAACAEIAAILGKCRADVGRRAVSVVGKRFDDQRDAARPEALLADLLVIDSISACRLFFRPMFCAFGHRMC
jgi:hypothetical protein